MDNTNNKKLTVADIANSLGVSKTTVSRAMSGKGRISDHTRKRVEDFIKENNYKPNVLARGLATSKTYNIGVSLPIDLTLSDLPFFQKCLIGITKVATENDYDILVVLESQDDNTQLERIISNNKVDGIILTRTFKEDIAVELLKETNTPFIAIGTLQDKDVIQVDNNHRVACKELTNLLFSQGNNKIGLLGGNDKFIVTHNRYKGYVDACLERGIDLDKSTIYINADNEFMVNEAVNNFMSNGVDCILCMDDHICDLVLRKLHNDDIKIPQKIKVASFYNSTILENNIPSITSLQFQDEKLGELACKTLFDCILEKNVKSKKYNDYKILEKISTANLS